MKTYAGIPIRNIWLLMLYASDFNLAQTRQAITHIEHPHNSDGLVAWFIQQLQDYLRQPDSAYISKHQASTHIRGKVDLKTTYQRQSMKRGQVYCRYAELSLDHVQHQYLYYALRRVMSEIPSTFKAQALYCQRRFQQMGVSKVAHLELAVNHTQMGLALQRLKQLLQLATLLLEFQIPTTDVGKFSLQQPNVDDVHWLRRLFEKAMVGFYKKYLQGGWRVLHGAVLTWPQHAQHSNMPHMKTDLILSHPKGRCILIDTKFTQIFQQGYYRKHDLLKNQHIYQLYTYLRSQEYPGSRFQFSQGILLYPSTGQQVQLNVQLQHYPIGFYTLDLTQMSAHIEQQLLSFIGEAVHIDCDHIS